MPTEPGILDASLDTYQSRCEKLVLCSERPATYAEATNTPANGGKKLAERTPAAGEFSKLDATPAGSRKLSIAIVTGPAGEASGSAGYWVAINTADGKMIDDPHQLSTPIDVTQGNPVDWPRLECINDPFA